ncbi:MAG: O-antigen ligase family protein, partial [Acidobacteria bacterium]|nr:O-antigen ligase family protein [Acidobacteriota bacterium]
MGLIIGLSRHQGTIVYSLLGLDWLFLFAQFGGYAVTELQVHALFLSLAALVLALNRQALKLPKLGWALVGIPLLVFGLLLIPASPSAMAWLNPVKADLAQQTASLFPALKASPQLAITPPLHLFKGLRWITDIALCLILINCPRPQFGLFRAIIRLVAAFVFILANMQANGLLAGKGWIHRYADTMGGIVNPNHFATAVILILFLLLSINLREIQKLRKRRLSGAMSQDRLLRKMAFIALDWFLILLGLLAWRESHSRAGMILMVVGMAFFICMLLWPIMGKNRWLILPGGITVATLLLLFVPFGTLITKWEREGTSLGSRTEALQVGFDYLKQRP